MNSDFGSDIFFDDEGDQPAPPVRSPGSKDSKSSPGPRRQRGAAADAKADPGADPDPVAEPAAVPRARARRDDDDDGPGAGAGGGEGEGGGSDAAGGQAAETRPGRSRSGRKRGARGSRRGRREPGEDRAEAPAGSDAAPLPVPLRGHGDDDDDDDQDRDRDRDELRRGRPTYEADDAEDEAEDRSAAASSQAIAGAGRDDADDDADNADDPDDPDDEEDEDRDQERDQDREPTQGQERDRDQDREGSRRRRGRKRGKGRRDRERSEGPPALLPVERAREDQERPERPERERPDRERHDRPDRERDRDRDRGRERGRERDRDRQRGSEERPRWREEVAAGSQDSARGLPSQLRVAILIDARELESQAKSAGTEVSFGHLRRHLAANRVSVRAIAYHGARQKRLAASLAQGGFEVVAMEPKVSPNIHMAVDAMSVADRVDCVILVPGNKELEPLAKTMRGRGVRVETASFVEAEEAPLPGQHHHHLGSESAFRL